LQRALAGHVALGPAEVLEGIRQRARQQPPQPRDHLWRACSLKLSPLPVCLQERLLNHVGGIELTLKMAAKLHAGQEQEVRAILLYGETLRSGVGIHGRVSTRAEIGTDVVR